MWKVKVLLVVITIYACMYIGAKSDGEYVATTPIPESTCTPDIAPVAADETIAVDVPDVPPEQTHREIETLKSLVTDYQTQTRPESTSVDGTNWSSLLVAGDLYSRGAYPRLRPNDKVALECYMCAASCPDPVVAGIGQSRYISTRLHPVNMVDRRGADIPVEYGHMLCEIAKVRIGQVRGEWRRPKMPGRDQRAATPPDRRNTEQATAPIVAIVPVQLRRANSQNVHEHTIIAAAKKNIQNLLRVGDAYIDRGCMTRAKDELRVIANTVDANIGGNAMLVIDKLGHMNHGTFGCSEVEVFSRVWMVIEKMDNDDVKANLKETLLKRLADCIEENNTTVCSTGRVTRILSTLEGVEDIIGVEKSRPMWAVTEEIGTLAVKVRDRCLDAVSIERRNAYIAGEDKELADEMKAQFETEAYKTYAQTLGMSMAILEPLVKIYSDSF
jgi:hypothetical protein